jgi:Transposase DDE domain
MKKEQVYLLKLLLKIINKVKPNSLVNLARVKMLAITILALCHSRSVNISLLSHNIRDGEVISKFKRMQRFFDFHWPWDLVARIVLAFHSQMIGNVEETKYRLSMDRTNWCIGKLSVNFLVVGIVWNGMCLPLVWTLLSDKKDITIGKKGNSHCKERTELLQKVLEVIPATSIISLLADREFIGSIWIEWLNQNNVPFVIRVKGNHLVEGVNIYKRFKDKKHQNNQKQVYQKTIMGSLLWICGTELEKDYLITISNIPNIDYFEEYSHRWDIECMFKCLKTKGFNLESTRITSLIRLNNLMSVLVLAFTWCCVIGTIINQSKPIRLAKRGQKMIKVTSFFRYGLDYLKNILSSLTGQLKEYRRLVDFLWCG